MKLKALGPQGLLAFFFAYISTCIMDTVNLHKEVEMKYKHIEASREARLWIGQVIVPAIGTAMLVLSNPRAREWASEKASGVKTWLKGKIGS